MDRGEFHSSQSVGDDVIAFDQKRQQPKAIKRKVKNERKKKAAQSASLVAQDAVKTVQWCSGVKTCPPGDVATSFQMARGADTGMAARAVERKMCDQEWLLLRLTDDQQEYIALLRHFDASDVSIDITIRCFATEMGLLDGVGGVAPSMEALSGDDDARRSYQTGEMLSREVLVGMGECGITDDTRRHSFFTERSDIYSDFMDEEAERQQISRLELERRTGITSESFSGSGKIFVGGGTGSASTLVGFNLELVTHPGGEASVELRIGGSTDPDIAKHCIENLKTSGDRPKLL